MLPLLEYHLQGQTHPSPAAVAAELRLHGPERCESKVSISA